MHPSQNMTLILNCCAPGLSVQNNSRCCAAMAPADALDCGRSCPFSCNHGSRCNRTTAAQLITTASPGATHVTVAAGVTAATHVTVAAAAAPPPPPLVLVLPLLHRCRHHRPCWHGRLMHGICWCSCIRQHLHHSIARYAATVPPASTVTAAAQQISFSKRSEQYYECVIIARDAASQAAAIALEPHPLLPHAHCRGTSGNWHGSSCSRTPNHFAPQCLVLCVADWSPFGCCCHAAPV